MCRAENANFSIPDPVRLGSRGALGNENLVAYGLPPQNANADRVEDRLVDQLAHLAVGACGCPHQLLEVEKERLLHDVDGWNALGKLIEPRDTHLDSARFDGAHGLVVYVELALVEDLDGDGTVRLLLCVLLETHEALAQQRVGRRKLKGNPEFGLLAFCR